MAVWLKQKSRMGHVQFHDMLDRERARVVPHLGLRSWPSGPPGCRSWWGPQAMILGPGNWRRSLKGPVG